MKRILTLAVAAVLLLGALGAAAEEGRMAPLYATVGEALKAAGEGRVVAGGVPGEYYAVVTQKDGKYYRSVANYDEKLTELTAVVDSLDYEAVDYFEKFEAANKAVDDYLMTLPIAYTEEFTASPLTEEEMAAMVGKTIGQLTEEGFETQSSGTENGENDEMLIVFAMRGGVFDYNCEVDTDFDGYLAAQDNGTEDKLVVKKVTLGGITEQGAHLRFHADGTVEEPVDPFARINELAEAVIRLMSQNGGEADVAGVTKTLKESFPELADMVDMYVLMYQTYGADGFASMMTPAPAEDPVPAEDDVRLSDDASGFVLLSEAVPDAILEIRYYSTYNFVGDRIDGYEEPIAFLTKEAAAALKEVSDELIEKGYRLKIYDAYRPQKAVTHFMNWALDPGDVRMKAYFYPELEKNVLFPQGYIAEHSGHSRGSTVDLTLFDMKTGKEADMGGTFDYFGELSHPDYTGVTEAQLANRMLLREAMMRHGFKPLPEEWWHFTLENEPYPDTYFTFPVRSDSLSR